MSKYMTAKATRYVVFKKELIFADVTVITLIGLVSAHAFHLGS